MKNRLKIRLWDMLLQKYIKLNEIDYRNEELTVHYDGDIFDTVLDKSNLKSCVIEQCTGSKDCHGDLVYEGDILEIWEDMGVSYVAVVWNDEQKKWDIEGDTEGDYDFWELVDLDSDNKNNDVGIVGNIHENSDLL